MDNISQAIGRHTAATNEVCILNSNVRSIRWITKWQFHSVQQLLLAFMGQSQAHFSSLILFWHISCHSHHETFVNIQQRTWKIACLSIFVVVSTRNLHTFCFSNSCFAWVKEDRIETMCCSIRMVLWSLRILCRLFWNNYDKKFPIFKFLTIQNASLFNEISVTKLNWFQISTSVCLDFIATLKY